MDSRRFDTWARSMTNASGSRRQLTVGLFGAVVVRAVASLTATDAVAKKKRKKKKPQNQCLSGETSCPKGFPSPCCSAGTTCCDTSRLGCCAV